MSSTHPPHRSTNNTGSLIAAAAIGAATGWLLGHHHRNTLTQRLAEADRLAHTDPLTGLPNRRAALGALDHDPVAMLGVLDLDKFKAINDTYGHAVGDQLLTLVGRRLTQATRGHGLAARLGGDEFLLIWHHPHRDPAATGQQVLRVLHQPTRIAGIPITPAGSLGIALATPHAARRQLLVAADHAAIAAKADAAHCVIHS